MINAWLDLPVPLMVLVAVVVFAASAALFNWLTHHSTLAEPIGGCRGIVGPFFETIAVLFALFMGFLAADVWDRKSRAAHVVHSERDALAALLTLAATNQQVAGQINDVVTDYATSVVRDEWQRMRQQLSSPEAAERMERLLHTIGSAAGYPPSVHEAMLEKAIAAREARTERIMLSHDRTEMLKWLAVIVLALVTQFAIAVVHLDRSVPQRMALFLYSAAAVFAICVVAAYERPFDGPLSIPPDPLAELIGVRQ